MAGVIRYLGTQGLNSERSDSVPGYGKGRDRASNSEQIRAEFEAALKQSLEFRHDRSCLAIGSLKATWALYSLHEAWEKRGLP
jgi:hypothetical protein